MVGEWPAEAGRSAYLAAFHAAQALVAERTDRAVKTHKGVNASFQRLTMGDTRIDCDLPGFLSRGYDLKVSADYGTGPDAIVPRVRRWQPRSDLSLAARRRYWRQIAAPKPPTEESAVGA
jgi:hypothetical protein